MKVILAVVLCAIVISISCNERIIIERDNPNMIYKVKFLSEDLSETIKTIDVIDENPYNNLPFELKEMDSYGNKVYINIPFDEFFPDTDDFIAESIQSINTIEKLVVFGGAYIREGYLICQYRAGVFERGIGKTTFQIYNASGELIYQILDATDGTRALNITQNGKYIFYMSGYSFLEPFEQIRKKTNSYSIIDISKNELIFEYIYNTGYIPNQPVVKYNVFRISGSKGVRPEDRKYLYTFFHMVNMKIYTIELPHDKLITMKELNDEGMVFETENGDREMIPYESDEFEAEDF